MRNILFTFTFFFFYTSPSNFRLCYIINNKILVIKSVKKNIIVKKMSQAVTYYQDLNEIILEIGRQLPQLSGFINHFNSIVNQNNVNVVTDSVGNMSIDVPVNMSDAIADEVSQKIGIVDRLINNHGQSINELFNKGSKIEEGIKASNSNYTSQLTEQIAEFKKLNASYKH